MNSNRIDVIVVDRSHLHKHSYVSGTGQLYVLLLIGHDKWHHGIKCRYAKCMAQRAKSGGKGTWGGAASPPHQLGDMGECCKFPERGPGRSRRKI